jgi:hypothetical protein
MLSIPRDEEEHLAAVYVKVSTYTGEDAAIPAQAVISVTGNGCFYPKGLFNHVPRADDAARLPGQSLRQALVHR